MKSVRAGLAAAEGVDPREVPTTSLELKLQARGASPRQMAAGANGNVLVSTGPGKVKSGFAGMLGGGIVGQLTSKLNPFSAKDPYTKLDCTVARVDIVDGQVKVEPVLMQSEKVTVTADGKVDLHTEELVVDFNTRPRKGIGVSPGMFTNPFLKLDGTLVSPRLGVGAKGAASGGVAAATAGASVVVRGSSIASPERRTCASRRSRRPRAPRTRRRDRDGPGLSISVELIEGQFLAPACSPRRPPWSCSGRLAEPFCRSAPSPYSTADSEPGLRDLGKDEDRARDRPRLLGEGRTTPPS